MVVTAGLYCILLLACIVYFIHTHKPTLCKVVPSLTGIHVLVSRMRWVDLLCHTVRLVLEVLGRLIFGIMYSGNPHTPLPPITNLILLESATALATKIRTRKVLLLYVLYYYFIIFKKGDNLAKRKKIIIMKLNECIKNACRSFL